MVATTGKTGRELDEVRIAAGSDAGGDFLNVGAMGHASQVAMGLAMGQPTRKVWCLDGDGASIEALCDERAVVEAVEQQCKAACKGKLTGFEVPTR